MRMPTGIPVNAPGVQSNYKFCVVCETPTQCKAYDFKADMCKACSAELPPVTETQAGAASIRLTFAGAR